MAASPPTDAPVIIGSLIIAVMSELLPGRMMQFVPDLGIAISMLRGIMKLDEVKERGILPDLSKGLMTFIDSIPKPNRAKFDLDIIRNATSSFVYKDMSIEDEDLSDECDDLLRSLAVGNSVRIEGAKQRLSVLREENPAKPLLEKPKDEVMPDLSGIKKRRQR